ncbi:MAG: hypothetical protein IKM61_09885 [Eubacteriaceae bacterium]|nr:hypothetical protein [Eubacteriaceae bacterium]
MKKIISLILIAFIVLSLASCSKNAEVCKPLKEHFSIKESDSSLLRGAVQDINREGSSGEYSVRAVQAITYEDVICVYLEVSGGKAPSILKWSLEKNGKTYAPAGASSNIENTEPDENGNFGVFASFGAYDDVFDDDDALTLICEIPSGEEISLSWKLKNIGESYEEDFETKYFSGEVSLNPISCYEHIVAGNSDDVNEIVKTISYVSITGKDIPVKGTSSGGGTGNSFRRRVYFTEIFDTSRVKSVKVVDKEFRLEK